METFKNDVDSGLSSNPKSLSSKYFYDKKGDALFAEIMNLPEYYLTRCELDIFQNKTGELIEAFGVNSETYFELIELGAGDGTKTKELLRALAAQNYSFDYFPIDISSNVLEVLEKDLMKELPTVSVQTKQGDYFDVLASLKTSNKPKVILFLGSNIGNMNDDLAADFLHNLGANLSSGDKLLLGVDIIKPQEIVLPAYDDSKGVTAKFNLNLLERINNELGANFDLDNFQHQAEYNQDEGIAKSFIVSTEEQIVSIEATGKSYHFGKGEKIHTEISRKYNDELIEKITANSQFMQHQKIVDSKSYFADYILIRD
ncbi:MAG: L-histidine N(alpha)-methyltransferase [Bacteroidetes bacterium]|nr:L-histidine N(alpha)-methyltransferase [Bacteroidota bacterium]